VAVGRLVLLLCEKIFSDELACRLAVFVTKEGNIPEFVTLQYLASLREVRKQMRSSAVYILTASIIGDFKYSMTEQTVAVTWLVKEINAGSVIFIKLQ
jgi:hypothetical protein